MNLWIIIALLCYLIAKTIEKILRSLKIDQTRDKYVLITGCDSGFGYMLTKRLDLSGFNVFACCLMETGIVNISEQCSRHVVPVKMDVTCDVSIANAFNEIRKLLPEERGLWALVNNAGVLGGIGPGLWQNRQDYDTTMAINVHGMAMVTNTFISLVKQAKGRVVNMSSVLGRFSLGPLPYCVSKFGVEALSDGLRRELYWTGVKVCIIEAGNFNTSLLDKDAYRHRLEEKAKHLPQHIKDKIPPDAVDKVTSGFAKFVDILASSNTELVVDAYFRAINARYPKKRYLIGFDAKYIFRPLWMLPEWLSDFMVALVTSK